MGFILYLEVVVLVALSTGQDIFDRQTCNSGSCVQQSSETLIRDLLRRLETLEDAVKNLEEVVKQQKQTEEELLNDVKLLNDTVNILKGQGATPSPVPSKPTVVHEQPVMTPPPYTIPTTGQMGHDFYLTFPLQYKYHQIIMSSENKGWATITVPSLGMRDNITINVGTTYRNITPEVGMGYPNVSETYKDNKGIYIFTSTPVTMYALAVGWYDITPYIAPIYDKKFLGTEYISGASAQSSRLCVVSTQDNTLVTITVRTEGNFLYDGRLYRNGDILTVILDYLSTFSLTLESLAIAGTKVKSTNPVVVMEVWRSDFKQLPATKHWSKDFLLWKTPGKYYTHFLVPYSRNVSVGIVSNANGDYSDRVESTSIPVPRDIYFQDGFVKVMANDSVMISQIVESFDKFMFVPSISQFKYNYSCPLPYFYRPYTPAYENHVIVLLEGNSIDGIYINDHKVTSDNVEMSLRTVLNNATQIVYNVHTAHHVHVISKYVKVGVIINGYSHGVPKSREYLFPCT